MLDRKNARLMDLVNNQLARQTGKPGADAFRPLGWMIRGIDTWESNQPRALEDLRAHARQGVVDLYDFLVEQPATFSCSPEEFILGYRPALEAAVPPEHVAALEAWYRGVGTVFRWLDVPRGEALDDATADRFRQEVGRALTGVADVLLPAQEAWGRIRARLG
ncbi:MAG: hypothetical protein E6J20_12790 [Chloroflexi bacterium]|nr:MAG: hypothetical protein E6J20_12790 [Chloroflexota bacterium]